MRHSEAGRIVAAGWEALALAVPAIEIDAFVVMPNHIHGLIVVRGDRDGAEGAIRESPLQRNGGKRRMTLPLVVGRFKMLTAKEINSMRGAAGRPVWQRGYFEQVVRSESSLERIRLYIANNPARWACDRDNPQALRPEPQDAWLP
jgi:REP element-mobilizing transposase RayT